MKDVVAIVRSNRTVEGQSADPAPISEPAPDKTQNIARLALIGHLDVKYELAFWQPVASIVRFAP